MTTRAAPLAREHLEPCAIIETERRRIATREAIDRCTRGDQRGLERSERVPDAYKNSSLTFKVTATNGTTAVESMTLAHQRIKAVSTFGDTLALEMANGDRVAYDAVWAFL